MKQILFILFLFPLVLFSQSFDDLSVSEKKLLNQKRYLDFLKSEGYTPSVSESGNISFKKEGDTYWIDNNSDEKFFKIIRYLTNKDQGCSNLIKKLVQNANYEYKSLTVRLLGDDCGFIEFKSSSLLPRPDDFKMIFNRSMDIVGYGVEWLKDEYKGDN